MKSTSKLFLASWMVFCSPLFAQETANNSENETIVAKFCKVDTTTWEQSETFEFNRKNISARIRVFWPKNETRPVLLSPSTIFLATMELGLGPLIEDGLLSRLTELHFVLGLPNDSGFGAAFCSNVQDDPTKAVMLVNRRTFTYSQQLTRLIPHEISHWILGKNSLPRWFEEGLATLQEYRVEHKPTGPWALSSLRQPLVGLTGLDNKKLLEEPQLRLSAYGQAALFLIYLEREGGYSLLKYSRDHLQAEAKGIINAYISEHASTKFKNFEDAFVHYIAARNLNRYDNYAEKDKQTLPFLFVTTEGQTMNGEKVVRATPPTLAPWSGVVVGEDQPAPPAGHSDYWIESSVTQRFQIEKWTPSCSFRECLRIRVRFD